MGQEMTLPWLAALVLLCALVAGGGGAAVWYWLKHRERLDDRIKRILVEALAQVQPLDVPTLPEG